MLLTGTMYPVALMPDWIRISARALLFSYGMEAMVASLTQNASISDLTNTLLPLLGFAAVLPIIWGIHVPAHGASDAPDRVTGDRVSGVSPCPPRGWWHRRSDLAVLSNDDTRLQGVHLETGSRPNPSRY